MNKNTRTTYRTGFDRVYDCPAGRRILAQLAKTRRNREGQS